MSGAKLGAVSTATLGFDLADLGVRIGVADDEEIILADFSWGEIAIAGVTGAERSQVREAVFLGFHTRLEGATVQQLGASFALPLRHFLIPAEQPKLVADRHVQLALQSCLGVR